MSIVSNGVLGAAMKCLACGAEMRLLHVRTDTTTPFAIERRIFQCSSCRQTAQRLGFERSGQPDWTAPAVKGYAPATLSLSHHSITSSASASRVGGISTLNAFAVARFITISYLVPSSTGKSPAFSPLRIRPT